MWIVGDLPENQYIFRSENLDYMGTHANIFKSENLSIKEHTNVFKSVKPDYTQLALPMVLLPIKSIFIVEATKNTRSMESCFGKSWISQSFLTGWSQKVNC